MNVYYFTLVLCEETQHYKESVHIQIIHDFTWLYMILTFVLLMFYAMNVKVGPYSRPL